MGRLHTISDENIPLHLHLRQLDDAELLDAWEQTVILEACSILDAVNLTFPRQNYEQAIVSELTMRSISRSLAASSPSATKQVVVFENNK
jgi:hypothetical protein